MNSIEITDYQQALFPYAYNILGSVEDAKDVVQEAMTKHLAAPPEAVINNLKNYLIKSVINLAINTKSRQQKTLRQQDVWLPEPVATDDAADRNMHLKEVLSYSLMVLMERLNATERAVFILRETFDYAHEEIADVLSISEEYSRKTLSRAKAKLFKPAEVQIAITDSYKYDVMDRYISAIRHRDTGQLERILAADIRYYADGGGKVPLAATYCEGYADVSALQMMVFEKFLGDATVQYATINHQPAMLIYKGKKLIACMVLDVHPVTGVIMQLNNVMDPDKLKYLEVN